MNHFIVVCHCNLVPKNAYDAFELLFPGVERPPMYIGREQIQTLADHQIVGSDVVQYLRALARNKEPFASYFLLDEEDNIKQHWDLITGKRIQ